MLFRLLHSFVSQSVVPDRILVVDQGHEPLTGLEQSFPTLPLVYHHVSFQSLTKARNVGVSLSSSDCIGFLDDDVVLSSTYVERVRAFFSVHPNALGVQGVITDFETGHAKKVGGNRLVYRVYNMFASIFFLNHSSKTNKLLLSGRNQYASRPTGIQSCEWLSGIGNYRRRVFDTYSFDEYLKGYAFGEDKLFSYRIFQDYRNALFLDPAIQCEHRHATDGRPTDKAMVRMKIRYTFYVWQKLFSSRGITAWLAYWWANVGDMFVVACSVLFGTHTLQFLWWHIVEYWHIVWTRETQI